MFLICAATGCLDEGEELRAGMPSGKADGGECASERETIAEARAWLKADDAFYKGVSFSDEVATTESMGDLNGDGVPDLLVSPGLSYAGANAEMVVLLTQRVAGTDYACATLPVGHFAAASVEIADDDERHHGVLDLLETNTSNDKCATLVTRYSFDGKRYVAGVWSCWW